MTSSPDLPRWLVPHRNGLVWDEIPSLPPLVLADGSGPAVQQTRVRIAWEDEGLHVRFDCEDRDAWGTFEQRDDPIYEEEAVEIFLAAGTADPIDYFEVEVSPRGVLWDGRIHNPTSRRTDMVSDKSWDCPGLRWTVGRGDFPQETRQDWWATFLLPWSGLGPAVPLPLWRANFYRIERPRDSRDGEPEFSGWSPTLTRPADFHKPARFGVLELGGASISR
jgi:hypothetical protein